MSAAPIPPAGPLTDWLRDEARHPREYGRAGEYPPMFWLAQYLNENPPDADRIDAAVEALLGEGDAAVSFHLLSAARSGPPSLRAAVARAVGAHAATLARLQGPHGRSLLADAVDAIRTWVSARSGAAAPSATVEVLSNITRREDGWPTSLLLGLIIDFARFAPRLVPALQQLGPDEQQRFLLAIVISAEPQLAAIVDRIAAEAPDDLKRQVAAHLESSLAQLAESRASLASLGIAPPDRDPPDIEYARYAARLGIARD
jgi:hypothetical protein